MSCVVAFLVIESMVFEDFVHWRRCTLPEVVG